MEVFKFLKEVLGLGNGDLTLLLALKKDWVLSTNDVSKKLNIRYSHAYRILKTFNSYGWCRIERKQMKDKKGNEINRFNTFFVFNEKGKKLVNEVFEKKILPKIPLTPDEFIKTNELDLIVEKK